MKRVVVFAIVLVALMVSGCAPALSLESENAHEPQVAASTPVAAAAGDSVVPAGWTTHASQQCEYTISYPSEMEVTEQSPYSKLFAFKQPSGQEATPNFVYVSVITPAVQLKVADGAYQSEVYNYEPAVTDALLKLQVGDSKPMSEIADLQSWFTYERQADATIGGFAAQAYENARPWEFPAATREFRYYVSTGGCMYLIGGYVDASDMKKPGSITEELFRQIMGRVQLMP